MIIDLILIVAEGYYRMNSEYNSRKTIPALHSKSALKKGLQERKLILIQSIDSALSVRAYNGKLSQLSDYLRIIDVLKDNTIDSAEDRMKAAGVIYYNDIVE